MTVTVLLENHLSPETNLKLKTAPGLSLHIETDSSKILLDAGPDRKFAGNADVMGVDIARVDQMVVSHAHSDHGGGLARFLTLN
jgi:7,8-dihydropterin-6-yl-methyl-4-(beta-D-ribofuranosyl)aminobenzene 5'-phosphate synthase